MSSRKDVSLSPTNSSGQNQHLSIIPLSKLKTYMSQGQKSMRTLLEQPIKSSIAKPMDDYRTDLNLANLSCLQSKRQKLTRAKQLSLSPGGARRSVTPTQAGCSYLQPKGELIEQKQQELQHQVLSHVNSTPTVQPVCIDSVKGDNSTEIRRVTYSLSSTEERKKERLNSVKRQLSHEEGFKNSLERDNMTPSSLLLLQNHNYIDNQQQQQQQQRNTIEDNDGNQNQQDRVRETTTTQARTNVSSCIGSASTISDRTVERNQTSCNERLLPSSSPLMLNSINPFRAADAICNPSNDSQSTSAATDYQAARQSHLHNQQTPSSDLTVSTTISNAQQNYQQDVSNFGNPDTIPHFIHYGGQGNRLSNYQTNFTSPIHEMQAKHEGSLANRANSSTSSGQNTNTNSLSTRGQQQVCSGINHYYGAHYNLIPSALSKPSSSPASTNSTPSPKAAIMHTIGVQHPNQHHVQSNSSSTTQTHIDQLNQHYMSNNVNVNANVLNHSQHQVSQQYCYQQATNGANQHLIASSHDQGYAHQQQQHHNQHHNISAPQSIYNQLANTTNNSGINHVYGNAINSNHYQNHLQGGVTGHQSSHFISGAHQNHLNTAAAACAAAVVVSQTLKTVASQHGQQSHYGNSIATGFNGNTGSLINISAQHHQQFSNQSQLNQHQVNHQVQSQDQQHHQNISGTTNSTVVSRKYQCKMCPQVFMSKAEMKFHNQNHMREAKPYKCLQCPKAFANSSYLSQHMRIHQGVKPYTCDICSRKFTQLSHLQQHKRTHTGDKPYKCNYVNCSKQFSQLSNLQSHSRCHQLDKPYKCNSCYKCFHDEQSLLEHIPRHLESKHLKKNLCIFCGSSYQQERGLVKHFQQYHTDKPPTLVAAAIAAGTTGNTALIASLVSSVQSNAFAAPSNGSNSSGSSSSSSSISSSGSLNLHNHLGVPHTAPGVFGAGQY